MNQNNQLSPQDHYEMGWNDAIGNLRLASGSIAEKQSWVSKLEKGKIKLHLDTKDYINGAIEGARAYLQTGDETPFKGPADVVAKLTKLVKRQ